MGIIAWIVLGLAAGAIARAIGPNAPGGIIVTMLTGILGALLGGFIASSVFGASVNEQFFDLGTWIAAIGGGVLVSFLWSIIAGRRG
ncbi:GlsB/YeaQ/YmgE family stress response membrane protein [Nesterenkonia aerolata]|uniref:GlsB/YeaQ/YmgE family stress response membrane protein n=1 Tax=Nesterenkonia aerolata TaxID=3074079 RepID=A0ABU2DQH4_9MICC|nr:GlsB/YeaQ/YmgE family stress response membrane protein [Nesterenkonia sp. LY-0111]MDR8018755.1 GlsB/YeaQ/YmgE family stress response membrane protein [Nesterenkonia sp. LY-0111]